MTMEEMQNQLAKRTLRMQAFPTPGATMPWCVWLWADDDPSLGVITAEGRTVELAFRDCINQWDGIVEDDEDDEDAGRELDARNQRL